MSVRKFRAPMPSFTPFFLAAILSVPVQLFDFSSALARTLPTSPPADAPALTITKIGAIQGAGDTATPGTYTIEGIVTGVYVGLEPAGFYVQEVAAASDNNPATSDAIFVVQNSPIVRIGEQVRVTGTALEGADAPSFGQAVLTRITGLVTLSEGNTLPTFQTITNGTFSAGALEPYEGMRVQFSGPMTVADVYNLRYRGELILTPSGLLYQPTQFIDPNDEQATGTNSTGTSNVNAINAYQAANLNTAIVLDDGSSANNPKSIPYLDATLGTARVGSTIPQLRGVLGYGAGRWRVQPLPGADAPVLKAVRPTMPQFGSLDLKVVSFNVLNYFNGDGAGGGFPTQRGAKTPVDFARQRSKVITALVQMNADVVGLTEIENDGTGPTSAIQDLVNGLNQTMGAGTYAFVNDGGATQQPNNTDVIHCALIYKPATVKPLGQALVATVPGIFERPPLAQVFATRKSRPDTLGIVVNHFKSRVGGSGVNADQNDGQGGYNDRRRTQARELVQFINTRVIPAGAHRVMSIGDYNANYEEDPIDILRAAGLVAATPPTSASFVFKGLTGSLDHCVITPNLVGFIDVKKWNINSAEPLFLQYDVAGEATDISSPFRSSDHDPVLIGVNFAGMAPSTTKGRLFVQSTTAGTGGPRAFRVPAGSAPLQLEFSLLQGQRLLSLNGSPSLLQAELDRYTAHLAPGIYILRLRGNGINQTQRVVKD